MEEKMQVAPAQVPEMERTALLPLNRMYMEDDKRKMNFLIKNTVENIFAGLVDLQRFIKAFDPESDVSVYTGVPGQVGFTVQYFKKKIKISGRGDHHAHAHTTNYRGMSKIEELTYPNFIKTSSSMEINGAPGATNFTSTYLDDRGDGTVLVMLASTEKMPDFWKDSGLFFCILPCFLICAPMCMSMEMSQFQAMSMRMLTEYQKYLSVTTVETTSFYVIPTPTAAVVQSAPSSPGNDIIQQLENLKKFYEQGVLNAEQYESAKNKVVRG